MPEHVFRALRQLVGLIGGKGEFGGFSNGRGDAVQE